MLTRNFSSNSPKSVAHAKWLKNKSASLKKPKASAETADLSSQQPASDVQIASTAGPSLQTLIPQQTLHPVVSSSVPALIRINPEQDGGIADEWRPDDTDDSDDLEISAIISSQLAERALAIRDSHEAESNKENVAEIPESPLKSPGKYRITDPHPNAHRVPFDTSTSELSEDEGFQQQHQRQDINSRRMQKPTIKRSAAEPTGSQRRSPKKTRRQGSAARDARIATPVEDEEARPPPSQVEVYKMANAEAKARKVIQGKKPQTRRPWSEEETETLLDLICKHGTSWTQLKNEDNCNGNVLEWRDQVALKDKARNMKLDYLK